MPSDKVENALHEHIRELEGSGMLTAYYLVAEFLDKDGTPSWMTLSHADQSITTSMGLIEWARTDVHRQAGRFLDFIYDDDEGDDD